MKSNYSERKTVSSLPYVLAILSLLSGNNDAFGQWSNVSTGYPNVALYDVKFTDDNNGVAVGRDHGSKTGYIFKTTNGGTSWTTFTVPMTFFRAVGFSSQTMATAAGYPDVPSNANIIYNTTNAAASWNISANPTSYKGIEHIQFLNSNDGVAIGYGSSFAPNTGVYKTTDGGATWSTVNSHNAYSQQGFFMTSVSTGFLASGIGAASGSIEKTTNGGLSFTTCYAGNWIQDVTFVNPNVGFAVEGLTSTNVIGTTDGGVSWTTLATFGSTIFGTLLFRNVTEGWMIENNGIIRRSADGGVTWLAETSSTTSHLYRISRSANYLWACGNGGTVVKRPLAAAAPSSNFSFGNRICANTNHVFTDMSSDSPNSWNWSVTPATGVTLSSATSQTTSILFPSAGVYSVAMTASNGTLTGNTLVQTVTVNPNPTLTVSASQTVQCINSTVSLTASGATTYSWTGAVSNATTGVTTFTTGAVEGPVTFTVTGANTAGCKAAAAITVSTSNCTGIAPSEADAGVLFFPNPFRSELTVSGFKGNFEMYNVYGQLLIRSEMEGTQTINTTGLEGDLFILKLYNEHGLPVKTLKLMKE